MKQNFKKILFLLSSEERKKMYLLIVMLLIMALIDMIGVASIMPFLIVLTDPEIIQTNILIKAMYNIAVKFGINTNQEFTYALGILVFLLLGFSLALKTVTFYFQSRFISLREYSIGKRLIEGYLNQPYSWFLNRNSANLSKNILSEVETVVNNGIGAMINLIAHGVVAITLIILLIIADPKLALVICIILGTAYGIIYTLIRSLLSSYGKKRLKSNNLRFSAVSESFGAAKEIKIGGLENIYVNRFSEPAKNYSKYKAMIFALGLLPRYAIELIVFGGLLVVILYLMANSSSFLSIVPIIALYAFAGYRLMPALQQLYLNVSFLRTIAPALDSIYNDLKSCISSNTSVKSNILNLNKNIILKNVHYDYPNSERTALKNINLTIKAKTTVGIVGTTGSGKTTTVDIILGLLDAQQGTLQVDEKIIDKNNKRAWQNSIGYVPQHIYLSDDTIASNISFGINPKDIDKKKIERAAKIANLHDFVVNELPLKYQTIVGERGVRLSGGQRQRIGIARALYNNPQVLILDEATSALDNRTENEVMKAINKIEKDITIILIAHRLNTMKNCDNIFLLENGKIIAKGTFEELIDNNDSFRKNANKDL